LIHRLEKIVETCSSREKHTSRPKEKKESAIIPTMVTDSGSDTEVSDDASHDETGQMDQMQFDLDIGNLSCVICKYACDILLQNHTLFYQLYWRYFVHTCLCFCNSLSHSCIL